MTVKPQNQAASDTDMKLAQILPRDALLHQIGRIQDLQTAAEGWSILRPERRVTIPSIDVYGGTLPPNSPPFHRASARIPPLCLSKYANVRVLPHQLIRTAPGILSGDSCEEYVTAEDNTRWLTDALAFQYNGEQIAYPRLDSCGWHQGQNIMDIAPAKSFPLINVEGPVLDITSWYGNNISHWLVDVLPRLWALPFIREKNLKVLIPQRVPSGRPPFMVESLSLMGFEEEDIIWFDNNRRYKIDTLYVPSRVASHYNFFSPEIIEFYKALPQRIQNFTPGTDPLVYISRQDSNQRRCLNEPELEEALKARGFRILLLSDVDFEERVAIFHGARVLVGASGAGMSHALMMNDHTKLFVMAAPDMKVGSTLFQNIAAAKQQSMELMLGTPQVEEPLHQTDWSLDLEATLTRIDATLATL